MNVPIVMISQTEVMAPEVEAFVKESGQPLVRYIKPREWWHAHEEINRFINIAKARTEAFRVALKEHEGEWFFSLDADIVPPPTTIPMLLAKRKEIIGGWFPAKRGCWVGGQFRDRVFWMYGHPMPGLSETALLSLGCTLVHRSIVEGRDFDPGVNALVINHNNELCFLADSGAFSKSAILAGHRLFLDGDVVCRHLGVD